MNPLAWPVVVGTLLLGSPALYAVAVTGTLSPDVAGTRLLLCAAVAWAVCSLVAQLVDHAAAANKPLATVEDPVPVIADDTAVDPLA